MKRRFYEVISFAIIAILCISVSGFTKSALNPAKSSSKHKKLKRSLEKPTLPAAENKYVVRQGDNISRIAKKFKTSPEILLSINNLKNDKLQIGQKLIISLSEKAATGVEKQAALQKAPVPDNNAESQDAAVQTKEGDEAETGNEPARIRLIEAGFKLIGVKYRFSGISEKSGLDCSGLVKTLFSKFNIDLPRSSKEQFRQGEKVRRDQLEAGDLVFFSSGGAQPTHVGIYVGDNKFLHAARKAKRVIVSDLDKIWYTMRYLGARRVADLWADEPDPEQNNNEK